MGLFDSCNPSRAASDPLLLIPQEGSCQNCHSEPPVEPVCPAERDWPPELFRPIEAIHRDPESFRWWLEENHLRTTLRRRTRQEVFPLELGRHSMRIEINPNATAIDSMFVTGDTRFNINLSGEGLRIFLNASNLLEGRDLGWIGNVRVLFENQFLTSDSILVNHFTPLRHVVLDLIPVAFDPETGQTYNYTQYTRMALISTQCGAPTFTAPSSSPFDGGLPPPLTGSRLESDGGPVLDLPPEVIEQMRMSAPNLGTGYADAGCGFWEALPERFPYLFELAHNIANGTREATQIDLLRLYPDILALQRLSSRRRDAASSGPDFFSFLESLRVTWNVAPERLAFENFLLEFDPETSRNPIALTLVMRGSRDGRSAPLISMIRSIETDSRIHLSRLLIPGRIHMGATTARLQGSGPDLSVHLTEINGALLPFDVGQTDPSQRGWFHIAGGVVRDGVETNVNGTTFRPGLHVEEAGADALQYSANLHWEATVEISEEAGLGFLGPGSYELSGDLLASGRLVRREWDIEPEARSSFMTLRNLRIVPSTAMGESRPFLAGASLTASDLPSLASDPMDRRTGFRVQWTAPETSFSGIQAIEGETFLPVEILDLETQRISGTWENTDPSAQAVYRPDYSLQNFSTDIRFDLTGRRGTRDARGTLHVETHQPEACLRTYDATVDVDQIGFPISRGISLFLRPIHAQFHVNHRLTQERLHEFDAPIFEILANASPRGGVLRGPVRVFQRHADRSPLRATYDPYQSRLDFRNVDVRLGTRRIVIPALINESRESPDSPAQITGVDLDGLFRGHFSIDLEHGRGRGRLCLSGDSADISLRGSDGRILPDPLVSDTRWCATSVRRVDSRHHILWGNFFLDTTFDWGLLRFFGIHLNMRERTRMAHDNLPYWVDGYPYIERLFFRRVGQEHRERLRVGEGAP